MCRASIIPWGQQQNPHPADTLPRLRAHVLAAFHALFHKHVPMELSQLVPAGEMAEVRWGGVESPGATGKAAQNPPPHQGPCTSRASPLSGSAGSDLPGDVGSQGPSAMAWRQCTSTGSALRGIILVIDKYGCITLMAPESGRLWGHWVPQNDLALLPEGSWSSGEECWSGHGVLGLPCARRGHPMQGKQALAKPWHTEHCFVDLTQEILFLVQEILFKGSWDRAVPLVGQGRPRGHVQILARDLPCHRFITITKALRYGHHNWD